MEELQAELERTRKRLKAEKRAKEEAVARVKKEAEKEKEEAVARAKEEAEARVKKEAEKEKEEALARAKEEAEKDKIEAVARAKKESDALGNGVFYAPFTSLWITDRELFKVEDMNALKRTKIPNFPVRTGVKTLRYVYVLTADNARRRDTVVKDDGSSARTSHKSEKLRNKIWPCDIFRNDYDGNDDADAAVAAVSTGLKTEEPIYSDEEAANILVKLAEFQQKPDYRGPDSDRQKLGEDADETETTTVTVRGEIAHLVPASPLHASLYYNVARWVFGLGNDTSIEAIHKIIHGCKKKKERNRISNVGLKHFSCNKIRLSGQKPFFDDDPCLMIIPTLSIAQILEWDGKGYDAIALIGAKDKNLRAVAEGVRLTRKGPEANEEDIEIARVNITAALKALAASLKSPPSAGLTDKHLEELRKYEGVLAQIDGNKGVKVPIARNPNEKRPVRKISFVSQNENRGHPAPDPMLLLIKSSINWSKHHNEQLLAAGEMDSDDEISESSMLAEIACWEQVQAFQEEKFHNKIIGQTIDIV